MPVRLKSGLEQHGLDRDLSRILCRKCLRHGHLLNRDVIKIQYSDVTGQWNVKGKNADLGNALVNMTYGTSRRNAYQILEDSLNLKDSRVYDTVIEDGKERRVLNKKETTIAAQKQDAMRKPSGTGYSVTWTGVMNS